MWNGIFREPNHEPIAWLEIFAGCVGCGTLLLFFLQVAGPGRHVSVIVSLGVALTAFGVAALLPRNQRLTAGCLRLLSGVSVVFGLINSFVTLRGLE